MNIQNTPPSLVMLLMKLCAVQYPVDTMRGVVNFMLTLQE